MARHLSEEQAWRYLASLWDAPHVDEYGAYVRINEDKFPGLCRCVLFLRLRGRISDVNEGRMDDRLRRYRAKKQIHFFYFWPTTKEHAADRAKLCRQFAGACKRTRRRSSQRGFMGR